MDAQQLRALAEGLMAKLMDKDQEIHFKQTKIDLLTHEIARYKRLQFAAKSEQAACRSAQPARRDTGCRLAALEAELQALSPAPAEQTDTADASQGQAPSRTALPAHLPRVEIQPRAREHPAAAAAR
jgi:transposase